MNITLKKLASRTLYSTFQRGFASSSIGDLLSKQCQQNDRRNAVRFENQGKTWDFRELNEHSTAFALGLVELGYKPGDRLVFWFDRAQTSQIITAQIGAAKVGVSIVPVDVKNAGELESVLKETEGKGLFISPNGKLSEDTKYIDVVNEAVPVLQKAYYGQPLKFDKLPKLKHVVHTGFHSINGALKYRHILVYGNPNFVTSTLPKTAGDSVLFYVKKGGNYQSITHDQIQQKGEEFWKQNSIQKGDTLLVIGNVNSPSVFAYGVCSSLAHGSYVITSGGEPFKDIIMKQRVQKSNIVLINDNKLAPADVQSALLDDEAAGALKKVFASSNIPGLDKLFKKSVQQFDPLLA